MPPHKQASNASVKLVADTSAPLIAYLRAINDALQTKRATEHTYRPMLKTLIESLAGDVAAINEPKRSACGAPDLIVMHKTTPLGYIEAKDIAESLDKAEKSEQLQRYFKGLGNLILTDYAEFRWYVQGKLRLRASLAKKDVKSNSLQALAEGVEQVGELLKQFLHAEIPTVTSPKELAERMAGLVRVIRDIILRALRQENVSGTLHEQMKSFRDVLLHDLKDEQFADMYAQTICYGLFAACCNLRQSGRGSQRFTRREAARDLPKTNPFLRKLFQFVAGADLDDEPYAWAVDDLAELLDRADIGAILQDFGKRTRREDPVVHFYETFLADYDPKLRETRGVYYTPEPVVNYIVRSVDGILRTEFGLVDGLADASKISVPDADGTGVREMHRLLILDPATGTGTFLYAVIGHIYEAFKRNRGKWPTYVSQELLPRLYGFELLMAPYAVAHLKLGLQLGALGYDFKSDERLRVYLTNTLEEAHEAANRLPFAQWLAEEANAASGVKQHAPVMVVLGNPPYSGHSINTGAWIAGLLRGQDTLTNEATGNYFAVDGAPLGERNPKWLNDDYVKFIRFAQWRIEQTGYGVLAFITNHGYLDNPTFRGMRQSLMETFDDIYVLDLHGNSKKKERAPDGTKDENVFDIQQGVAIGIFIKREGAKQESATVRHADLWGVREVRKANAHGEMELIGGKYHWLEQHDLSTTEWTTLAPQSPFYLFKRQDTNLLAEYGQGWKVTEMMPVNVLGFQTHRDHFAIDFDKSELHKRIVALRDIEATDNELRERFSLGSWDVKKARTKIRRDDNWEASFITCLYRPFDKRASYFNGAVMDRPRNELLDHVLGMKNICLGLGRQGVAVNDPQWSLITISQEPVDANIFRRGGVNIFPLYLYAKVKANLFDSLDNTPPRNRRTNLAPEFIAEMEKRLQMQFIADGKGDRTKTFGPEDVFDYMYAVFHSPAYRTRYAEFLKTDFPRLPLTANAVLFRALCDAGAQLIALHLMKQRGAYEASYPVEGDDIIERVTYTAPTNDAPEGRVWINKTQFFEGVAPEVWNFHVGGYRVCEKWLKDRKGRTLSFQDLAHYSRIVAALADTIRLMASIDELIHKHDGWPLGATET